MPSWKSSACLPAQQASRRTLFAAGVASLVALPLAPVLIRAQEAGALPATNSAPAVADRAEEAAILRVVLVDEQRQPVAGMRVTAIVDWAKHPGEIVTDERGEFTIPRRWIPGPDDTRRHNSIVVVQDGFERLAWHTFQPAEGKLLPNERVTLRLLRRSRVVTGRLLNETGQPLVGVPLSIQHLSRPGPGNQSANLNAAPVTGPPSGPDGRFTVPVPEECAFGLHPAHPDRIQGHRFVDPGEKDVGDIVLRPAGIIAGTVLDATTGAPLSERYVAAQATDPDHLGDRFAVSAMWQSALTDAAGRYELRGLPPGDYNVLFAGQQHPSRLVAPAHDGVVVHAGKVVEADFRARPAVRLFGRVLDGENRPIPKVSVGYYGAANPQSGAASDMLETNAAGEFEFFVPPGKARIYFAGGMGGVYEMDREESSREFKIPEVAAFGPKDLKVAKSKFIGSIWDSAGPITTGPAAEAATSKPPRLLVQFRASGERKVRSGSVHMFRGNSQQALQTGDISSSSCELPVARSLLRMPLTLVAVIDGFRPAIVQVAPLSGVPDPETVIPLTPSVLIPVHGRIANHAGQPVAGARIRVRRNLYRQEMQFPWGAESTSAADGSFTIDHIQAGDRFQLEVDTGTQKRATTPWMQVEEAPELTIPEVKLPE